MHYFIVLPPGHGKSVLHNPLTRIYEADGVIDCKATEELRLLRAHAKVSREWDSYDTVWIREMIARLPPRPCLVLLPARALGDKAGWTHLGTFALEYSAWVHNMRFRQDGVEKHHDCWLEAATNGMIVPSNDALNSKVYRILSDILADWAGL